MGEQPRRICHSDAMRAFLVCTVRYDSGGGGESDDVMEEQNFIRLIDDQTFEVTTHRRDMMRGSTVKTRAVEMLCVWDPPCHNVEL